MDEGKKFDPYRSHEFSEEELEKTRQVHEKKMKIDELYRGIFDNLDNLLNLLKEKERSAYSVLKNLRGKDSEEAWEIRKRVDPLERELTESVTGIDSPEAWEIRRVGFEGYGPVYNFRRSESLKSLEGIDSPRARDMREKYRDQDPKSVLLSLKSINTEEADEFRKEIMEKWHDYVFEGSKMIDEFLLESIAGLESQWDWEMRNKCLKFFPDEVIKSLSGIDSKQAWRIRKGNVKEHPKSVLLSLKGLDTKEARKIRNEYKDSLSSIVLESIDGINSRDAWQLRNELKDRYPLEVARSLQGLEDTENVLELKKHLAEKHKDNGKILASLLK